MRFGLFREFKESSGLGVLQIASYLANDLKAILRELTTGLSRLTFLENFEAFEVTLTIPAASEQSIPNELKTAIPTKWVAFRKDSYALSVCDGDTEWSRQYVYLKNTHASQAAHLTVVFFR